MDEQKVLVTGGAGYTGSHACKELQRSGFISVTFDDQVTGRRDAVKFGPFEQGDLINKAAGRLKLLKEHGLELSVSFEN